jgi:cytoskeletal protein CcmA (bactofilin family)
LANTVRVTGVVEGDLIAAAQQVVIDGTVRGDVRAAGALVQLNGVVDHNVTSAAQLLQLASGGRVNGSVVGAGETLAIDGDVGGSFAGAGRDFVLQGRIGRGAELGVNSLTVGPSGRIGGKLTYYAQEEQAIPQGAAGGGVEYQHVERRDKAAAAHRSYAPSRFIGAVGNFLSLAWLAGSAVVGLVFLRLFPRFAAEFLAVLETRPLPSLGMGALVLIGTLPVAVLVAITVVGLPLSALLVAGYFSGIFVGWLLLAMAAGSILVGIVRRRPLHHSWSFLLGLLVLYLLTRIPVAGGLLWFAGISLGTGAFVLTLHQTWRRKDSLAMPAYPGALPGAAM